MNIFDCFLLSNELDLLDLRFMTLNDVVDYFVIVEANITHAGNKREFLFEKNRNKFKKYLDKVINVKITDTSHIDTSKDIFAIEVFQRNCIVRGLEKASGEDKIIVSDVDEIPDPVRINEVRDSSEPVIFNQHLFYYYVNCIARRSWNGPIIVPFKNMRPPQELRKMARRGANRIRNSGWHYSYLGGLERIKSKMGNAPEGTMLMRKIGSDEDILRKMGAQKGLWEENVSYSIVDIYENNLAPKRMKEFVIKYPYVFYNNAS